MNKEGIDVSKWQGTIDWKKVKAAGIDFAMIRLGYGSSSGENCKIDASFDINVDGALAAGIDVGIYFYSYALGVAAVAKEAAFVVEKLDPYKGRITYPIAYDLENESQKNLGKDILTAMVKAFCSAIEDAGYYACFYCNLNWYRNRLDMEVLKVYDLWLAQWGYTATSYSCGMWQYTCKGSVSGINGDVDMNIAYKDYPALTRGLRSRNQASNFKDVPADHWAAEAVGRVVEAGIMGGQPDGTFQGDAPTTRYELASALDRLMQK